jgi:putative membrane protein
LPDKIPTYIQEHLETIQFQGKGKTIMMGGGMMGGFGGLGLIGLIFNLLVLVGIVLLVVWAVKRFTSSNPSSSIQTPKEILQSRYARGEITRDQYQQMLSDLG